MSKFGYLVRMPFSSSNHWTRRKISLRGCIATRPFETVRGLIRIFRWVSGQVEVRLIIMRSNDGCHPDVGMVMLDPEHPACNGARRERVYRSEGMQWELPARRGGSRSTARVRRRCIHRVLRHQTGRGPLLRGAPRETVGDFALKYLLAGCPGHLPPRALLRLGRFRARPRLLRSG